MYNMHGNAVDSNGVNHIVTVVGLYTQQKEHVMVNEPISVGVGHKVVEGELTYPHTTKVRTLALGYSICHPNDEFNEAAGVSIAKSRAKKAPIGTVTSTDVTMLNDDACTALVLTELNHITKNIEKYIN